MHVLLVMLHYYGLAMLLVPPSSFSCFPFKIYLSTLQNNWVFDIDVVLSRTQIWRMNTFPLVGFLW